MTRTIHDILGEITEKAEEIVQLSKELRKPLGNLPEIPF